MQIILTDIFLRKNVTLWLINIALVRSISFLKLLLLVDPWVSHTLLA